MEVARRSGADYGAALDWPLERMLVANLRLIQSMRTENEAMKEARNSAR